MPNATANNVGNFTPWTLGMIDFLADGEWHSQRDIAIEGSLFVPPIKAIRARDKRCLQQQKGYIRKPKPEIPREEKIRIGSYAIAYDALWQYVKSHSETYEKKDGYIRQRPSSTKGDRG